MDWTNIVTTLLTVGGTIAVAWITYGLKKSTSEASAKTLATNEAIMERIDRLEQLQKKDTQISERQDLLTAIKIDGENIPEIMHIARRYFLELKGNSIASKPFAAWSIKHNVDISELYTDHNDLKLYVENPSLCIEAYQKIIKD